MRRVLKIALAVVAIAVAISIVSNWIFWERLLTFPKETNITNTEWYHPKELVGGESKSDFPASLSSGPPQISKEAQDQTIRYAEKMNSSGLIVIHNDKIVLEQYWRGHSSERHTNSASMAKTVLGLLIGIAIKQDKIHSIDEPAASYLPEWRQDSRSKITIRNLLEMNSGLKNDDDRKNPFSDIARMQFGSNIEKTVLAIPAVRLPGQDFEYNNFNSQILGIILERATGERYSSFLSKSLWKPMGAANAELWLDRKGGHARTYCCLFARTRDWARLGLLLLHSGKVDENQIVPVEWLNKMLRPSENEENYGLHIWLGYSLGKRKNEDQTEPFLSRDVFYLDGQAKQRVYVVPSKSLVVVRVGENARGWDDAVLVNSLLRGMN